jgi:inosine/xanthosine triphosphate pyrophosphatase family protein
MKKKILMVTGNKGKLKDFREILKKFTTYELISLDDVEDDFDKPEENGTNFAENSALKAEYFGKN